ncbi:MAG: hypothetical protein ABJ360_19475 [Roseobacter sp.]
MTIDEPEVSYDDVAIATSAMSDRDLAIPGGDLPRGVSATEFVSWYNGHPGFCNHSFDRSRPSVVVIGNGNVALDVRRILAKTPEELAARDICEHAMGTLSASQVTDITLVGQRGPLHASFSIRKLCEFNTISGIEPVFDPADIDAADASPEQLKDASRNQHLKRGCTPGKPT